MAEKIFISACLVGELCRYDGAVIKDTALLNRLKSQRIEYIAACPELLGGLPVPRVAAQIQEGNGYDVLNGKTKVINEAGCDVTSNFIIGAKKVLKLVLKNGIKKAILKERSPSCGVKYIYNHSKLAEGAGVTAALLAGHGVMVISNEHNL